MYKTDKKWYFKCYERVISPRNRSHPSWLYFIRDYWCKYTYAICWFDTPTFCTF